MPLFEAEATVAVGFYDIPKYVFFKTKEFRFGYVRLSRGKVPVPLLLTGWSTCSPDDSDAIGLEAFPGAWTLVEGEGVDRDWLIFIVVTKLNLLNESETE